MIEWGKEKKSFNLLRLKLKRILDVNCKRRMFKNRILRRKSQENGKNKKRSR